MPSAEGASPIPLEGGLRIADLCPQARPLKVTAYADRDLRRIRTRRPGRTTAHPPHHDQAAPNFFRTARTPAPPVFALGNAAGHASTAPQPHSP
ncbi:hypothetical protein GCM10023082_66250 [Streptomyces tremellae]|uniref:Uncharacterized protein n=1 Tax=Streptomyces tremellae TaxID=1124239 RepID=A0ABP7GH21_9ACTN